MVVRSRWIWQMRNLAKQNGLFLGGFPCFLSISLNIWPKYYIWLESSGTEDSDATFPKSLGGTSKRTDFCDGGLKVVWPIAESLFWIKWMLHRKMIMKLGEKWLNRALPTMCETLWGQCQSDWTFKAWYQLGIINPSK